MAVDRQGRRVLSKKNFRFVDEVWGEFLRLLQLGVEQDVGEHVEAEMVDSDDE